MAKFCDVEKFKSAYEHRVGIQFDNAIHEMEKEEFCVNAIERSKIDKAILGMEREENSEFWNKTFRDGIKYALELLKKNLGIEESE